MKKERKRQVLSWVLDALIVIACVAVVLCVFSLKATLEEVDEDIRRAEQLLEAVRAERLARQGELPMVTIREQEADGEEAGEDPDEDALLEAALLEQGYFRDDVPLSYGLQDTLHTACEEFGVDYALALAVIERETEFTYVAGDGGESVGYFQIQPRWWGALLEEIGAEDLADPTQNLRAGCAILGLLLLRYGNAEDALTAYNTGHPGESEYAAAVMEAAERWEN